MPKKTTKKSGLLKTWQKCQSVTTSFISKNWIGLTVFIVLTTIFFWPFISHMGSYSPGGDAMFNAWTLSRDHHCLLHQNCPDYSNGNIFFPNSDTMLYSESQLSAGFLTLPLYFINHNPVFAYNAWTVLSFLFAGIFMYLLAKRLGRGNELFAIAAGLVFEFAPYKLTSLSHLQNLSIFYLPLIILLLISYLKKPTRKLLIGLFLVCVLQFYASWYQMAFVLIAVGITILGAWILKMTDWKRVLIAGGITALAVFATLPLAIQYSKFSKATNASYGINEQVLYSASLSDYFIPQKNTLAGRVYYQAKPKAKVNSFNPDSVSYHSFTLYAVAIAVIAASFLLRKRDDDYKYVYKWSLIFLVVALVGFFISLGPLLKLKDEFTYVSNTSAGALKVVIPMPYILIDVLAPKLSFIRAIGRSTVLTLFALSSLLALSPVLINKIKNKRLRYAIVGLVMVGLLFELMPLKIVGTTGNPYYHKLTIPPAYTFVKDSPDVNNLIILQTDYAYPGEKPPKNKLPRQAVFEQVLWAGYHNKNIFNGYSGYFPPGYNETLEDFTDFKADDVPKMRAFGIEYIMVDKLLSSSKPNYAKDIQTHSKSTVYEDERYIIFKI